MIESFLNSWELFQRTYLAGWLLAVLLSMVGVLVVARDQIFIGAAVSQASTLGIVAAMWVASLGPFHELHWMESQAFLSVCAVAASVVAALLTSGRREAGRESHESTTGWVFLLCASFSVLLASRSAHGLEEVQRLLSSSLIGASWGDVTMFAGLTLAVGAFLLVFRRRALLVLTDEEMARAAGIHTSVWNHGFSCLLGLTVGLALRTAGMLYTFGCLVLPCLAARNLCRRSFPVLILGPILGLAASVSSFVLANHYDQPPGQMAVAVLCVLVAITSVLRKAGRVA
jgi:ABC-type Mn2+/Zn2+ transport system permease subunit